MDLLFNKNENLVWVSVLFLALLVTFDSSYLNILVYWIVIILIIGNAKRVHGFKAKNLITFIRRSIYIWPLMFPIVVTLDFSFKPLNISWCILGLLMGVVFILPKISLWRIALSKDYISLTIQNGKFYYFMSIYSLVGGAISEELFFRYFLMYNQTNTLIIIINIVLSSLLFMLLHYGSKWSNEFSNYDITMQILFGLASAILYLFSGSIVPCIIAHLTYNLPHIILNIKKILFIRDQSLKIIGGKEDV